MQKAFAIVCDPWNEVFVIQKLTAALFLPVFLVSCDKARESASSDSAQESGPGRTRVERPSREVPGTRDKLRDALEAARLLPSGEERDKALAEVAWQALEPAPAIAGEAIAELTPGLEAKQALIEAYVRMLLKRETADRALAWADSLYDEQDRAFARGTVAFLLAETAPEQAAALLSPSGFTAAGVDPAAEQVLSAWVTKNPTEAVAWTTRLPAGEARSAGYRLVFSQWINADAPSAFAWVAFQSNPHVRREAVTAIAGAFSNFPDPIRDIILEPADPELRAEIQQGIADLVSQSQESEPAPETEAPEAAPEE